MCSATTLECSGLVRFVGLCAQTRVAVETHIRTDGVKRCMFERPTEQATEPCTKQEARRTVFFCHICR